MSALAEALVAAQSRAVGALQKQYVAGKIDGDTLRGRLSAIGLTDEVDQDRLTWALDTIREYGAALPSEPAPANGKAKDEPATDAQWALVKRLCGEKNQPVPDGPLTKVQAHECIDTLKAGTYDAGKWAVPF